MSSNWWAERLGGAAPAPPKPIAYTPLPAVPPPSSGGTMTDALTRGVPTNGGEAARTETTRCPACGGNLYFSRANSSEGIPAGMRGAAPSPRCFTCGHTG
jgi:hypothetical protein